MLGFSAAAFADQVSNYPLKEVVFDPSNPEMSVAVMGEQLLSLGDFYENTKVIGFEQDAVILHHFENAEAVKCLKQDAPEEDPRVHRAAVEFFIYKQMTAIYEAQTQYWNKFGRTYSPDIETLVRQGFLKGFENGMKENYFFEVVEVGQSKARVMMPREATFLAAASPRDGAASGTFFTVNRLGEVRYGATKVEAPWGPVWEYNEHLNIPKQQVIREI